MVVILLDGDKPPGPGNVEARRGDGTPCRHLRCDEHGKCSCAIHGGRYYKQTPCFRHGQIERGNTECRLGRYILGTKAA